MGEREPVQPARSEYDPHAIEDQVRDRWEDEDAFETVREAHADDPEFYFVDGPPYTSGHIHMGTAWNKVMKDLVVRFRRMEGYNVRDQPGYDMHGLPIEVKVEKELGISDKNEIEAYGVEGFVEKCREFSTGFLDTMNDEFAELGVWLDWDDPYRTIDDDYMEGAWWAIKRAEERDLLYQDNRGGLPWCPRCETALAQAEVEYEDRVDPSIYVKLPLVDDASLVVWTTTPWTLPANNAVAVHPDFDYARVLATTKDGDTEEIIVEETCVDAVAQAAGYRDTTVMQHLDGTELEGLAYEHPFEDEVPYHQQRRTENEYTVILGDHVEADRTGLVHTATGHGEEDYEVGTEQDIPPFSPVGENGFYTEEAGELAGLEVRKEPGEGGEPPEDHADQVVIDHLQDKGLLLAQSLDEHSYGHCWRCDTPILYRTAEQWFLAVRDLKQDMLDEIDRVEWTPEWAGAGRQRDWVENVRDWCISRQRYWGIPIPIWTCEDCSSRHVVASQAELEDRSGDDVPDLHRPWVDEVTFACTEEGCEGEMSRVVDVLDVWFDSAVASWASLSYPRHEDEYEEWFPCDFIVEGLDQTRGWFYSQLAAGTVAFDQVPYEEVVMHGFVHDDEGRPMSKSLGNIIAPEDVIEAHGVDPTRWSLLEPSAPWDDLKYGEDTAEQARRTLNIPWNVHRFATQYMAMDDYVAHEPGWEQAPPEDPLDRWVLSRLQATIDQASEELHGHEFHEAARTLESFVLEDLSRWYVRLTRDRAWEDGEAQTRLYDVLSVVLADVARLLAPYTPHVADQIWRDLYPEADTVHAEAWPEPDETLRDTELEGDMQLVRDIVEATSKAREQEKLSLRWPVPRVVLAGDKQVARACDRLEAVLADQCNAKRVEYAGPNWEELNLVAEPVRSIVGPEFREDAPAVKQAIREADAESLKKHVEAGESVELDGFDIPPEAVEFTTEVPEGILGADFEQGSVFVDAHLEPEHEQEGLSQEILRRIQEMRKRQDLEMEAVVDCTIGLDPQATVARAWEGELEDLESYLREAIEEEARVNLSFSFEGVSGSATAWEITNKASGEEETIRIELRGD
jgi:isoleucyl-tRNA synthetase